MRQVVITGGNKGIGLALTQMFVAAGDTVHIIARDFSNKEDFDYQNHPLVHCTAFDLTQLDKLPGLVESIKTIDVLVNNAGLLQPLTLDNSPDAQRDYSLALNLLAPIKLVELLTEKLLSPSDYMPRVVNNASIAGQIGHPDIWYGISKAGLINATKSFAKSFQGKVIVNAVAPSPTQTDMLENIPQARQEAFLKNTLAGRFATAQEVAKTLYWLATDSPEYINGTCIDINNGANQR